MRVVRITKIIIFVSFHFLAMNKLHIFKLKQDSEILHSIFCMFSICFVIRKSLKNDLYVVKNYCIICIVLNPIILNLNKKKDIPTIYDRIAKTKNGSM